MVECRVDDEVIALWKKLGDYRYWNEKPLEQLLNTDFGPIVKYFRFDLEECEIQIFEGVIEKYFFPWGIHIPYPDRTYCVPCEYDHHLEMCVRQMRMMVAWSMPQHQFYHFTTSPGLPSNTRARCAHFGYYGYSYGLFSTPHVSWYVPRIEIDTASASPNLHRYCYPSLTGRVTSNDTVLDTFFLGDVPDPRARIPSIDR